MSHSNHIIPLLLHLLGGGALGLIAASLAQSIGTRSADRMPGESRWPQCLYCLKPMNWQSAFPLFGWLLRPETALFPCPCGLRKHQWSQPAAELAGFVFGTAAMALSGWSPASVPLCLGIGLLPAMGLIDLEFGLIPDGLNLLLLLLGGLWMWLSGGDLFLALIVSGALLSLGLFCALVYSHWRGKEMLGLGDVKFFAAAGIWLQPMLAPWFLVGAGMIGVAVGIIWKRINDDKQFPFAPALCLSLLFCVLYQLFKMP